ncbi:MAG: uncharacterized protein JWR53_392 [Glaciihabitans sp.]|jgi:catechol 2,3-dioxygenase-like lactoylglutathione lyase family enzyme|nr:uncharacterized protein [Glaciihabitans sp.]MCU1533911.1 uncharacterized protein [Glaciihabitans sp.]MDQ1555279.1 hypothetical protein [Actinomycetota bacterium]
MIEALDQILVRAPLKLASIVMFVTDLDRSVDFYSTLLNLEPTLRDDTVALLVAPGGYQLYLRALGPRASHPLGGIGAQYALWSAASEADLDRCEAAMRQESTRVVVTQHDGFRMVEGRDPDDVPVIVSYPGPDLVARREIVPRIYGW